ncbi:MAG: ABC transporter permease [Planctomycetota bacterium]|jgi:simple sugar transport system permease protein|nr:ABC transporter permease [Planctomycetota bacterium]
MPEKIQRRWPIDMDSMILAGILVAILAFMGFALGDSFFNIRNISSMVSQIPEFAFLAMGMGVAMITGGIDLSNVAAMNLSGIVLALCLTSSRLAGGVGIWGAILIGAVSALLVGVACGVFNGLSISRFGIPPIIATLGSMLFFSGLGVGITNGEGITGLPEQFTRLINMTIVELPPPFLFMLAVFVVMSILAPRLTTGKTLYMYGSSRVAALFTGLRIGKSLALGYALSGLFAAVSALILVGRTNSIKVGYGDTYQLQAILVVVLGGVNPDGGKGKFGNILVAVLILQILQNAFTLFMFTPYAKKLIWGGMLLAFMVVRTLLEKWSDRRKIRARMAQMAEGA